MLHSAKSEAHTLNEINFTYADRNTHIDLYAQKRAIIVNSITLSCCCSVLLLISSVFGFLLLPCVTATSTLPALTQLS